MVPEGYAAWEEIEISTDKGRREVHFYLKRGDGRADLAVVGREKSVRHMAYHVTSQFLAVVGYMAAPSVSSGAARFSFKWRSKREVVDWLKTFISASHPYKSSSAVDRFLDDDDDDDEIADIAPPKDLSSSRVRHRSKEFSWLGSAWNCRKRRKHYRSFCRNGITVSVHDFVYIMAEDCKRLVAYVEDLYEDLRANRMVVVRWFHKVDEVAVVLPPDVNDREIFFSLCLQDFSVECIDGLAAVLSTQHFEKFQNEARRGNWEPYLCRRQIDNDDIKPFDVTQVQGYWSQELLRSMYTSSRKFKLKITYGGSNLDRENDTVFLSGTKRKQRSSNVDISAKAFSKSKTFGNGSRSEVQAPGTISAALGSMEELLKQKFQKMLYPGCNVEVLSQDSGVRGCWFRCMVLKKHQDKVKVRYQDILDADETGNLEEWVSASRIAVADKLGIRSSGRQIVRPQRTDKGMIQCSFNVGAVVDAWWNDGWWEGIVICKESEQKFHVYFPDERRASTFCKDDLRHSQDWVCFRWENIKDRPDITSSVLPNLASDGGIPPLVSSEQDGQPESDHTQAEETQSAKKVKCELRSGEEPLVQEQNVPNLVKDCMRNGLRWISSRKRRRVRDQDKGGLVCKRPSDGSCSSIQDEAAVALHRGQFLLPKSMTIDHDNCKGGGDLLFKAPISVSNLVMSR